MVKLNFHVAEPIHVVRDRLAAETEPWQFRLPWPLQGRHKLFEGEIWDDSFRVTAISPQRVRSTAYGHFTSQPTGTNVEIELGPRLPWMICLTLFLAILFLVATAVLCSNGFDPMLAIGFATIFVFLGGGSILAGIGFARDEARKAFRQVFPESAARQQTATASRTT